MFPLLRPFKYINNPDMPDIPEKYWFVREWGGARAGHHFYPANKKGQLVYLAQVVSYLGVGVVALLVNFSSVPFRTCMYVLAADIFVAFVLSIFIDLKAYKSGKQGQRTTKAQEAVLAGNEVEKPGTGKFLKVQGTGVYVCAACHQPLFTSDERLQNIDGFVGAPQNQAFQLVGEKVSCSVCQSTLGTTASDKRVKLYSAALNLERDEFVSEVGAD